MYGVPISGYHRGSHRRNLESCPPWSERTPLSHLFFADDLLLFGHATPSQVALTKRLLDHFCSLSGQKVSMAKTKMFFSKNTPTRDARNICHTLGFSITLDLGRYLGVPLLHSRVTKDTYKYIEDQTRRKLAGWKATTLSLAGRLTLAKSVLSTLPFYAMQSTKIPAGTIGRTEALIRNFIWGTTAARPGVHLIKWSHMCQPKEHGGCGLKNLRSQNDAFLLKLAHAINARPDLLWVQVIRAKYGWHNTPELRSKRRQALHLWRCLDPLWEDIRANTRWEVGDGQSVRFWSDHWVGDLGPLKLLASAPLGQEALNAPRHLPYCPCRLRLGPF